MGIDYSYSQPSQSATFGGDASDSDSNEIEALIQEDQAQLEYEHSQAFVYPPQPEVEFATTSPPLKVVSVGHHVSTTVGSICAGDFQRTVLLVRSVSRTICVGQSQIHFSKGGSSLIHLCFRSLNSKVDIIVDM
ncbi:hypothetical protein Rs2_05270 [Raphanus sativus]|nr:hypothetical protein Rs2_05270 [Raphanus sativus]